MIAVVAVCAIIWLIVVSPRTSIFLTCECSSDYLSNLIVNNFVLFAHGYHLGGSISSRRHPAMQKSYRSTYVRKATHNTIALGQVLSDWTRVRLLTLAA